MASLLHLTSIVFGFLAFVIIGITEAQVPLGDELCFFKDQRTQSTGITKAVATNIPCDQLENVAPGSATFSSSVHRRGAATEMAIDGNDESLFSSLKQPNPWWMIDLGSSRTVFAIMILTQRAYGERFHDVEIRFGDTLEKQGSFESHKLLLLYKGPYTVDQGTLMYSFTNGVTGRFLSMKISSAAPEYLQMKEVQIMAYKN